MKKVKLKDIANIQMGLVLSRAGAKQLELIKQNLIEKVSGSETFKYKAVTLRSIDDHGNLNEDQCDDFISKDKLTDRYLTVKNDILIRLFSPLKTCLINDLQENIVVPSQFGILRLKDNAQNDILPEYLQLVMQNKSFTNQVEKLEEGFQLRSIKTSSIENVEICIPTLQMQNKLIEIAKLMKQKEDLLSKLLEQQKIQNEILQEKLITGDL
ncbi:MAG: hypothetical protein LUH05_02215 [Candidatus Gastranaerophilales bacterium]|nr:hypothetical protein [Candidatus Gastranaerophilales bacterium]